MAGTQQEEVLYRVNGEATKMQQYMERALSAGMQGQSGSVGFFSDKVTATQSCLQGIKAIVATSSSLLLNENVQQPNTQSKV